jgi:hypothetical protein
MPTSFARALAHAAILSACVAIPTLSGCASADVVTTTDSDKKKDKKRDLDYAEAELRSARFDAEAKRIAAEDGLRKAQFELDAARAALAAHDKEAANEVAAATIDHDRRSHRADEAKDELAELEAMYRAEEFAKTTKELVLKRGRRGLEIAERELGVGRQKLALLTEHTMPQKRRELESKLASAEAALRKAEAELQKAKLDADLAVRKAADKVADLEKELRPPDVKS